MTSLSHIEVMGADEQQEGTLFLRLINPTDFDTAYEALRIELKKQLSLIDEFSYIGLFGGDLKEFLHRYVEASHEINSAISGFNKSTFYSYFKNKWGYTDEELNVYFNALLKMDSQNKIPRSIMYAYTYKPNEGGLVADTVKKTGKFVLGTVLLYGAGYLLIREILFKKGSKIVKVN